MKFLKYFLVLLFLGTSFAANSVEDLGGNEPDMYDYIDFESELDLDICGINRIQKMLHIITDFGRRLWGFDTKSYVLAKRNLDNVDYRVETILALLLALKYPNIYDAHDGISNIEIEIKEGDVCQFSDDFYEEFLLIGRSKIWVEIFDNIKSLSDYERYAIAKNLLEREHFLPSSNSRGRLQIYFTQIEQCFRPLLQNYIED